MKNCCISNNNDNKCFRKRDKKIFKLPRKFTKKNVKNKRIFNEKFMCSI